MQLLRAILLVGAALATQREAAPQTPDTVPAAGPVNRLLVLNKAEATVSFFDPATRREVALAEVGTGPHEVAVSPDGRQAVVCNYGDQRPGNTLSLLDVVAGTTTRTWELRGQEGAGDDRQERSYLRPHGVRFLPGGRQVLVTSESSRRLLVVDLETERVTRVFDTRQPTTHMVALSRDGGTAFCASIKDGTLSIFDLTNADATAGMARAEVVPTGAGAEGIAVSPSTGQVWVSNRGANTLSVYDHAARKVVAELATDDFPIRVAATPDGRHMLVSCAEAGNLQVFAADERRLVCTIELGGEHTELSPLPVGVCVQPDGRFAWVACMRGEFLAVIDLQTFAMVDRVQARQGPDGMAFAVIE